MFTKSFKRVLLSVVLIGATAGPSFAETNFDIDLNFAPPPTRYEVVPAARPGYVWAPGHWEWEDGRHIWIGGNWIEERPGYEFVPARWVHHGNHWGYTRARWIADERWDHNRDWRHEHRDWDHDRDDRDRDHDHWDRH